MNAEHPTIERLIDYLHGELPPAEDAPLLAHLEACNVCRDVYNSQARVGELLRAHALHTERDLPAKVKAGIWAAVDREQIAGTWWTQLGALFRPLVALPVGAALVVGVYFGVNSMHAGKPQPSIDAAYYLDDHDALTHAVAFDSAGAVVPASLISDDTEADQQWVSTGDASSTDDQP